MASLLSPSAAISLQLKLNRSSLSALSAHTPSKVSRAFIGDGRKRRRLSFKTRATGSVEGNVLDKESASTNDKIGSLFLFLLLFSVVLLDCNIYFCLEAMISLSYSEL
ncbi:hypothetical protein V6N11_062387 [Hibiscus sabdariffa]|uniref:Uncharacterized protein n=1 Tax=Hibiscus sabdariffa TaxID=183260 RepID=A0ABR2PSG5_9ROSI